MYSYDWSKQQSYLLTKPFEQHPIKQTQVTYNSSCTASSPPNTPPPVPSQSSMAIYIVSPTANIIYSSPTTIQTLGHSIIPGSSFLDYIHPDDLNEWVKNHQPLNTLKYWFKHWFPTLNCQLTRISDLWPMSITRFLMDLSSPSTIA